MPDRWRCPVCDATWPEAGYCAACGYEERSTVHEVGVKLGPVYSLSLTLPTSWDANGSASEANHAAAGHVDAVRRAAARVTLPATMKARPWEARPGELLGPGYDANGSPSE